MEGDRKVYKCKGNGYVVDYTPEWAKMLKEIKTSGIRNHPLLKKIQGEHPEAYRKVPIPCGRVLDKGNIQGDKCPNCGGDLDVIAEFKMVTLSKPVPKTPKRTKA